jgi:hypothetical protein
MGRGTNITTSAASAQASRKAQKLTPQGAQRTIREATAQFERVDAEHRNAEALISTLYSYHPPALTEVYERELKPRFDEADRRFRELQADVLSLPAAVPNNTDSNAISDIRRRAVSVIDRSNQVRQALHQVSRDVAELPRYQRHLLPVSRAEAEQEIEDVAKHIGTDVEFFEEGISPEDQAYLDSLIEPEMRILDAESAALSTWVDSLRQEPVPSQVVRKIVNEKDVYVDRVEGARSNVQSARSSARERLLGETYDSTRLAYYDLVRATTDAEKLRRADRLLFHARDAYAPDGEYYMPTYAEQLEELRRCANQIRDL